MEMTEEEFDSRFEETLENITIALAENPEISPEKFFSMTCMIENLRFFSPVLYGLLKSNKER